MFTTVGEWLGVAFLVGIVYVLVRPRSKAGEAVTGVMDMFASLVRAMVKDF